MFGLAGVLGTRQPSQAQFLLAILIGITGPCVAGVLLTAVVAGRSGLHDLRSRLFKWRVGARWYAVALLTGPLLASALLFSLSLIDSAFLPAIVASDDKLFLVLMGITVALAVGFFEELGWTGFAIPRLRLSHGILTTGVMVGLLWGAWHLLLFVGEGSPPGIPAGLYLLVLLFSFLPPFRVLMVWLHDRTRSLPLVMIMHASLTATSLILQPQTPGVGVMVYDLAFATMLWLVVVPVAWVNRGRHEQTEG